MVDSVATAETVDTVLPAPRLTALGLQHVLVMYSGAIAVPFIISKALGLTPDQLVLLLRADVFACGLATLVQAFGLPGIGIRLPVMMGVSFASVGPMFAIIGAAKAAGGAGFQAADALQLIYGAAIVGGVFALLVAPFVRSLLPLFPPVVTGTVIAVIGLSLMDIGIGWAEGKFTPAQGALSGYALAAFVLLVILALTKFGKGFVVNVAVLLGIAAGAVVAWATGFMDFGNVGSAPWFALVPPFQFGFPKFQFAADATFCVVMIVIMIESTGMFLAVGDMVGKPVDGAALTRGLRGDGLGTILGAIFNTFPYTSYSQNVGLVGVTGVRSRFVAVAGGAILLLLGLVPKLAAVVASIPTQVLGGAGVVMFGMVIATGVRILSQVDFKANRNNLFIVAISLGLGLVPTLEPDFFKNFPPALFPILKSGIILATVSAVLLNAYFNGLGDADAAAHELETARMPAKQA
ncbi:MAG: purine permease [Hyphomicrobiales bacterium]|nr:purine permease [Hyphomicrobiales bacterium]MDE2017829.1 purine permease [Hyphomicrobiales bacterium]